ncbi:MAG: GFA family protein [Sphingomicrobium sp.]
MIEVEGGCHCRAVRFRCTLADPPVAALSCNCSICEATGFVHIMASHGDFELVTGRGSLTSYRFGTGAAEHLFCATCGVKSFYQPRSHPEAWSVNANCLDHPPELAITPFDGRNWEWAKAGLDGGNAAD